MFQPVPSATIKINHDFSVQPVNPAASHAHPPAPAQPAKVAAFTLATVRRFALVRTFLVKSATLQVAAASNVSTLAARVLARTIA